MKWLETYWGRVAGVVAVVTTLGVVAAAGAEVQITLDELEETSEIAKANATAVGALVDIHEQEAIEKEKEQMAREYADNIAALMMQIAELQARLDAREEE